MITRFGFLTILLLPTLAVAQEPAPTPEEGLQALVNLFKPHVIEALPHPLYEKSSNWGHQEPAFHALRWNGIKPRVVKTLKNDGTWRKIRLDIRNPKSLVVKVHDARQVDAERLTFKVFLACQAQVEIEQQIWERGLRLYSGSARARFQLRANLDCESTMKVDTSKLLPDFTLRLRVTKANVAYHDPVVEHIAGFGGTAAKIVGEMLHDAVQQFRPSLEERLIERVNQSIVRAGDTKEIRLSLSKLVPKTK